MFHHATVQKILTILVLTVLSFGSDARAQTRAAGYIDTTFSAPCFNNPLRNTRARSLVVLPDGRILAGGDFTTVGGVSCVNAMARLSVDGARDGTFNAPLNPGSVVNALLLLPDGELIAGGRMSSEGDFFHVARLNRNGTLDDDFLRATLDVGTTVNALALLPDEKIIAAGQVQGALGTAGWIVRLRRNGSLDGTFGEQVVTPLSATLMAVAVQETNKILVGGSFNMYRNVARSGLVQVNDSGLVNEAFNPPISGEVRALLVQPDGRILVAGLFNADGFANRCLTRLNSDGSRDASFISLNGFGTRGLAIAVQPDGKIILGHDFGVVRVHTNGMVDTAFGPLNATSMLGTDADTAAAVALANDGKVLVGALDVTVNATEVRGVARLFGDVPPPPMIVQQPLAQTVVAGTNVSFSVIATGAPPIFYQWRRNNTAISGATNDVLEFSDVDSTHIGNYTVVVSNPGGAVTSSVARLEVEFSTSTLTLLVNGEGKVTPNLHEKVLEIGRTYNFLAKPARGHVFSNWTGSVTSTAPQLAFVMESNAVLQANFVPSPFIPLAGTYQGLFFDPENPAHENAGAVTLRLQPNGAFKGKLRMGKPQFPFAGTFTAEMNATATVARKGTTALELVLQLDPQTGVVTGTVSNENAWASSLQAERAGAATPFAGKFNILLPGADDAATSPAGDGYASLNVNTAGRVSGKGFLADGSALKFVSSVAASGNVPIYAPLYRGAGSLFGWLTFSNAAETEIHGSLLWTRPGTAPGALYPSGFTNETMVAGSRYTPPPAGTPVLMLENPVVILSGGNLSMPSVTPASLEADNTVVVGGPQSITLKLNAKKGQFTGSFDDDEIGRRKFKGVILRHQNVAGGFFLGPDQSGRVFFGDAPVPLP